MPPSPRRSLLFAPDALVELRRLKAGKNGAYKVEYQAVNQALRFMETDLTRPGLNVHKYKGRLCPHGDSLWEVYAQNNTPGAYRIFFCHAPKNHPSFPVATTLYVIAVEPHP